MLRHLAYSLLAVVFAGTLTIAAFAPATADTKQQAQVKTQTMQLRSVAPNRGQLVRGNPRFTSIGGNASVVCCTHWNTATGGTGCATYPDQCPAPLFTVECKADGCW